MKTRIWMLCVVLAVFAVPTFAQLSNYQQLREVDSEGGGGWYGASSYRQGQYLNNPCTVVNDLVWVDYSAYVEGEQKAVGMDRYILDESTTMGGMYAAAGTAQSDVHYSAPFSVRNYYKVNTGDNFHVVTVVNFDPASHYTSVTVETACGDGTPDSKE